MNKIYITRKTKMEILDMISYVGFHTRNIKGKEGVTADTETKRIYYKYNDDLKVKEIFIMEIDGYNTFMTHYAEINVNKELNSE